MNMGAPIWPPRPPAFGTPRRSRSAPLLRARLEGATSAHARTRGAPGTPPGFGSRAVDEDHIIVTPARSAGGPSDALRRRHVRDPLRDPSRRARPRRRGARLRVVVGARAHAHPGQPAEPVARWPQPPQGVL